MSAPRPALSRRKKLLFLLVYVAVLAITFFALAELVVRLRGEKPYALRDTQINVEPGGSLFTNHPTLGYTHRAGTFTVTLPGPYSFKVTHLPNTLRVTHPLDTYNSSTNKPAIWIMGCSFTHGWTLNDEDSYPWLLQTAMTEYEIGNFGVNGYGTLHSLLQFQEHLKTDPKAAIVVLAYSPFHDERSAMVRNWRKAVAPYNRLGLVSQPFARLDSQSQLKIDLRPVEYREWPLMRLSAFVHFLEQRWNQLDDRAARTHAVSEALVKRFAQLCREQNIQFVLAGITRDAGPMLEFCEREKILHTDIAVNLNEEGSRNLPYDDHPSAKSHRAYAQKLEAFLRDKVLGKK
ncbi:MAG: SGNH/GDSL hydrolase family protein [Verrucomicrobiota bacterium]